ncbi:MAG: response regulator transcription factor, partial [Thermomicrobiaceae bacterium]|nr:response regulator transcription factor [Thermomicrobiaceae bacterium]
MSIRILVVDDHPVVREGLVAILDAQPDMAVVGEAADGHEAVRAYRAERPDVVLMDLAMPGFDGVQAIQAIREFDPEAKVVVLTAYDTDERILQA